MKKVVIYTSDNWHHIEMVSTSRYYFICNPASNSGRLEKRWPDIKAEIEKYIDPDQFEYVFTKEPLHAVELSSQLVDEDFTHVISVGGDGIANEVVNGIMNSSSDLTFGMIPAGTSNDAHITHHFPNDPFEALPILFEDHVKRFGIGKITGDFGDEPQYFLDHADTGLAALAARSAKYGTKLFKGEWRYTFYALKNLVRFNKNKGRVIIDGEEYEGDFAVIAAGFGEDMSGYHLWPDNSNRAAGDFGILLARGHSRFGLLKLMLAAENGNHIGREGVDYLRGKKLEIHLEDPWPYQSEGEIFTDGSKDVIIEHIPKALSIVTGPNNIVD